VAETRRDDGRRNAGLPHDEAAPDRTDAPAKRATMPAVAVTLILVGSVGLGLSLYDLVRATKNGYSSDAGTFTVLGMKLIAVGVVALLIAIVYIQKARREAESKRLLAGQTTAG
jgi:hypothetical protein